MWIVKILYKSCAENKTVIFRLPKTEISTFFRRQQSNSNCHCFTSCEKAEQEYIAQKWQRIEWNKEFMKELCCLQTLQKFGKRTFAWYATSTFPERIFVQLSTGIKCRIAELLRMFSQTSRWFSLILNRLRVPGKTDFVLFLGTMVFSLQETLNR